MIGSLRLDDLWNSARPTGRTFDLAQTTGLPEGARRYLEHAIGVGTPLYSAVRLRMHGEIKIKGWNPFSAEEVIHWQRGMIWQAAVRLRGLPIHGRDCLVEGQGTTRWNLLGLIPIINASGIDIRRSAAGRLNIESIWLPSVLCDNSVALTALDESHLHARFSAHGETAEIDLAIDGTGCLKAVSMPRWGNPDGSDFRYFNFGGFADQECRFGGYTIPTRLRVGWHFGTQRFEPEGEFFRVIVDQAVYR